MASMMNKLKDTVTPKQHGTAEGVHGPHDSRVANAADPRIDSDHDHSHTIGSNNDSYTTSGNYGLSSSGPAPNTAGPHKSDMMNRADPRVDSDRDDSKTLGTNTKTGTHVPEGTYGPHGSRMANVVDPRVDSDRDRTIGMGANTGSATGTTFGTTGTTGTSEGLHGPHNSRMANAADPRVDSDRDHRAAGSTFGTTGTTGNTFGTTGTTGTSEGLHGPHNSRMANAADPRVDSDRDHRAAHTGGTTTSTRDEVTGRTAASIGGVEATGPAPHTAGPHKSDMLNKLDPRVDSNLDGSKTFPGNKTFAQSPDRDPRNASQVPPSVMQRHVGEPQIAHGDRGHDRARRNSQPTHQEMWNGL